jgi:hypothetical protein
VVDCADTLAQAADAVLRRFDAVEQARTPLDTLAFVHTIRYAGPTSEAEEQAVRQAIVVYRTARQR